MPRSSRRSVQRTRGRRALRRATVRRRHGERRCAPRALDRNSGLEPPRTDRPAPDRLHTPTNISLTLLNIFYRNDYTMFNFVDGNMGRILTSYHPSKVDSLRMTFISFFSLPITSKPSPDGKRVSREYNPRRSMPGF